MAIQVDESEELLTVNNKLSPIISISLCLILSILYVVSLYIWKQEYRRDHPITVKRRFFSVSIVTFISLAFVYFFSNKTFIKNATLLGALGLRSSGLLPALIAGFSLTAILFSGPICVEIMNGNVKTYFDINYWINGFQDTLWLRNHIMAPLTEELTFRACIMALLIQSFSPKTVVLITPFFFSIAHYHHLIEMKYIGIDLKTAFMISTFQFTYTTIFGYYSAYLFAKTGHFASSFIAHFFCNHMGFPDIQQIIEKEGNKKILLIIVYITGFVVWLYLLPRVTVPSWYNNKLYWNS